MFPWRLYQSHHTKSTSEAHQEEGNQDIMDNTTMDTFNNWVYVKYLYNPNLPDLGENYYGTTKRTHTLHVMIASQPAIAKKMNKYIQQQIDKWELHGDGPGRLQEGTLTPLCSLQLHGIQHQCSTRVRMTVQSSMHTKFGLSLNDVTQPALRDRAKFATVKTFIQDSPSNLSSSKPHWKIPSELQTEIGNNPKQRWISC